MGSKKSTFEPDLYLLAVLYIDLQNKKWNKINSYPDMAILMIVMGSFDEVMLKSTALNVTSLFGKFRLPCVCFFFFFFSQTKAFPLYISWFCTGDWIWHGELQAYTQMEIEVKEEYCPLIINYNRIPLLRPFFTVKSRSRCDEVVNVTEWILRIGKWHTGRVFARSEEAFP